MVDILINFRAAVAETGNWNSTDSIFSTGVKFADLIDSAGSSTGFSLSCDANASGKGGGGVNSIPTGDASWVDQAVISQQQMSVDNSTTAIYRLSGLTGGSYDIDIYSSYDTATTSDSSAILEVSVDNFATSSSADSNGNSSSVIALTGVAPTSGEITVSLRRDATSSFATAPFNAMRISAAATPSSTITDIDGDNSVRAGQTGAVITTTGIDAASVTQTVTLGGEPLTVTGWDV